jgi:hypothetical protein
MYSDLILFTRCADWLAPHQTGQHTPLRFMDILYEFPFVRVSLILLVLDIYCVNLCLLQVDAAAERRGGRYIARLC